MSVMEIAGKHGLYYRGMLINIFGNKLGMSGDYDVLLMKENA